jgi:hypothetical protein
MNRRDSYEMPLAVDGYGLAEHIEVIDAPIDSEGIKRINKVMVKTDLPVLKRTAKTSLRKALTVTVEIDLIKDRYQAVAVHVREGHGGSQGPLSSFDLSRVQVRAILRDAEIAIENYQVSTRSTGNDLLPLVLTKLHNPGRGGFDNKFYAQKFVDYLELLNAGTKAPLEALAAKHQVSSPTARKWVAQARSKRLATRPGKGRQGGQLTALGRKALK